VNYRHEEIPPECEERHFWHKRFNFAAWLFLIFAFYGIFFTDNFKAIFLCLAVSIAFRALDSINQIRHFKWHMKNDEGEIHE